MLRAPNLPQELRGLDLGALEKTTEKDLYIRTRPVNQMLNYVARQSSGASSRY